MTIIKKLIANGFKSFAKKTELVFGNDFNCILGPNGSGKSNIVDAITFVLGKTSAKQLRAERSSSLIYKGNKTSPAAKDAETIIYFDNNKKEFPIDSNEIKISRIVKISGFSTYRINDKVCTRQQVLDLLATAKIDPDGHNIILQGDVERFIEMKPEERRQVIEEVSGISVYEEKKQKALNELDKVESRLKEADIILTERSAHLRELKKDRDQAILYKELEKKIKENKATYLHLQITQKENKKEELNKRIESHQQDINKIQNKISELKELINSKKQEIANINKILEERGEKGQLDLRKSLEEIKEDLIKKETRLEVCESEIKKIENRKIQLKSNLDSLNKKILDLKKSEDILNKNVLDSTVKKETIEKQLTGSKGNIEEVKERRLSNFVVDKILNLNFEGVHNTIANLGRVDEKYALALEVSAGPRINSIVTENEEVAKKCIEYLRGNKLGVATFLPLNKLRETNIKQDVRTLKNIKGVQGLALDLIKYSPKYKSAFSYVFGNTLIVDDIETAKRIGIGRARMVTLKGDLIELSGAMTGGFRKEASKFKRGEEIDIFDLEEKLQKIKEELIDSTAELRNIKNQKDILSSEQDRNEKILKDQDKEIEEFKNEIITLRDNIKNLNNALKQKEKGEKKFFLDLKNLSNKRNNLNELIQQKETSLVREEERIRSIEQNINVISLDRAKVIAEIEGLQKEFEDFKTEKIKKGLSIDELKIDIQTCEKELQRLGNVNLRALEIYEEIEKEYQKLIEKVEKLKVEKQDVLVMMQEIESKKKDLFMKTFDNISSNFENIFSSLSTKEREAYLELENEENPFSGGLNIKVKIASNKYLDLKALSGGEKTLTALAFIFSIQEYQPASFYLLDEVDAALDKTNSEKLSKIVAQYAKKAQYIVVTHNDMVISEANQIYGVSMQNGISKVVSLKI